MAPFGAALAHVDCNAATFATVDLAVRTNGATVEEWAYELQSARCMARSLRLTSRVVVGY
jgi:hypothetical protein